MKKPLLLLLLALLILTVTKGQGLYFPPDHSSGEWATISPEALGWETDSISSLYDFLEAEQTKSFLLLKDGKIVLENYFGTYTQDSIWPWFSAGKSLRSLLIGIAQEEGLLDINDPVSDYLGQGWTALSQEREDSITVKHQLTMTSGLNEFLFFCTDPACLFYRAPAGTRWVYHNAPYSLTKQVLEAATGVTLNSFTNTRIENPLGGSNGFWIGDGGYNTFYISKARLMARYGLLIQNGGVWDGNSVITDTAYFNQMLRSSQPMNPAYGYLWWLNGQERYIGTDSPQSFPGPMAPDAPADVVLAAGAQGQFISVSRETGLMMIRQGSSSDSSLAPINLHNEIWRRIMTIASPSATDGHASPSDLSSGRAGLQVYPNPTSGNIRVAPPVNDYQVSVLDAQGRLLFTVANQAELNLAALPAGRYHLRLVDKVGMREGVVVKY